jgi:CRISPR/Cas system-associated exonuclease Cas4 (RecB family)
MTHYLALGNAVHLALEKAYTIPDEYTLYLPTVALEDTVALFLKEFRRIIEDDEVFATYPQLKKAEAEGIEMIARYYAKEIDMPHPDREVIGVEQEFKLPISGIEIVGKIDRIDRTSQGIEVIDYKTGSKKPDDWFLRRNLQFTAYYWATHELYGEYPTRVGWHHLRTGETLYQEREPWDIEQLKRIIDNTVKMSEQGMRHRVYHEKVCDWCEYSGHGNECDDHELEQKILEKASARG